VHLLLYSLYSHILVENCEFYTLLVCNDVVIHDRVFGIVCCLTAQITRPGLQSACQILGLPEMVSNFLKVFVCYTIRVIECVSDTVFMVSTELCL